MWEDLIDWSMFAEDAGANVSPAAVAQMLAQNPSSQLFEFAVSPEVQAQIVADLPTTAQYAEAIPQVVDPGAWGDAIPYLETGQPSAYAIPSGIVAISPAENAGKGIFNTASTWLKENEPVLKWGMSGLGGLAGYLSAQQYNKQAAAARKALALEKAKKDAIAKQLGATRKFDLARTRVAQPSGAGGKQAVYFNNNALSANPSTVLMADGGAVQQQFAPEYYTNGQLNMAKGGPVARTMFIGAGPQSLHEAYQTPDVKGLERLLSDNANIARSGLARRGGAMAQSSLPQLPRAQIRAVPIGSYADGGYFAGGASGQSDKIPAMLSDGEFVMDAETVSMLGDGNNAAGASALEQMRQSVRKQKRSAPINKIPPKSKKPEAYLKKGSK